MNRSFYFALLMSIIGYSCQNKSSSPHSQSSSVTINITWPESYDIVNGRMMLMISTDDSTEPRFQIRDNASTAQIFGMDIESWNGERSIPFDLSTFGYPVQSFDNLSPGEYTVQALFHKYEVFERGDGHTVIMPMDRGEGQQWNLAPDNIYSTPQKIHIDPSKKATHQIALENVIPAITPPEDSKYVKHIKMKSEMLSKFWGRDIILGAHVLLPEGFDEHPDVKYPLAIMHGHFPDDFGGWRTTPPDADLVEDYSERFKIKGYNRIVQQEAYDFYKMWTGPDFPRVIAIEIQHPTPFYDDSYAVNSANQGPYGDAITYELIPYIEKQFRGIGEGWARFTYGGSTGGWEALAVQVMYPEEYNGAYAACPDPIDFRAYCSVNLYEDDNAYYVEGPFRRTLRPGHRNYLGHIDATLQDMNYRELPLGTNSRSGQQWDIWEATFSPVGDNGYPVPIWDKKTGVIDKKVAEYWKENYDLAYILKRDWPKNGKNWQGKIHLYCGDMDNYYLNNAVYLAEEILEETTAPHYDGEVDYGDRAEHCWNGDHENGNHISRLRYHRMYIPKWTKEIQKRAPKGVNLKSWRY